MVSALPVQKPSFSPLPTVVTKVLAAAMVENKRITAGGTTRAKRSRGVK